MDEVADWDLCLTRAATAAIEPTLQGLVQGRLRPGVLRSQALPQGGPRCRPLGSGPTQLGPGAAHPQTANVYTY
jgi:hypothetical protein